LHKVLLCAVTTQYDKSGFEVHVNTKFVDRFLPDKKLYTHFYMERFSRDENGFAVLNGSIISRTDNLLCIFLAWHLKNCQSSVIFMSSIFPASTLTIFCCLVDAK